MLIRNQWTRKKNYAASPEVLCIGAPIVDALVHVPNSFLKKHKIHKGGSTIVSDDALKSVIKACGENVVYKAGGCAANTACSLAALDADVHFTGKIGNDHHGKVFCDAFESFGVFYNPVIDVDRQTAVLACLITPDKERSFVYSMNAARWFYDTESLPKVMPRIVYFESNNIDVKGSNDKDSVIESLLALRLYRGSVFVMNLNDSNLMDYTRDRILRIVSHVDIVMGNRQEFEGLFGVKNIKALADNPRVNDKICVITDGGEPVHLIHHAISERVIIPRVDSRDIVSTLGAGDAFAAGFIASYLKSDPLYMCVLSGAAQASKILKNVDGRP